MRIHLLVVLSLLCSCSIPQEGNMSVLFCPSEQCLQAYNEIAGLDPLCAFYDVDEPTLTGTLHNTIIHKENYDGFGTPRVPSRGLMHHKFCVAGNWVIGGSYNPTKSEADNLNNVVIMESETMADAYVSEWNRLMGKGRGVSSAQWSNETHLRKVIFCQVGDCQGEVLFRIQGAEHSISAMLFSFTDKEIMDALIAREDLERRVMLEKAGNKDTFETLVKGGIDVRFDEHRAKLHHKVWIIDDTVLTGSYNPTKNGNMNNDENLLVIEDAGIAQQFQGEFERLWIDNNK